MSLSPWLVPLRRSARTERRLICLPHAGGSAHTFRSLAAYLPEDIDMWSVQLPGRGSRFNEPPLQSMSEVLHELLPVVEMLLDYPSVLLGHSLGCRIGFELIRKLESEGRLVPSHFIASGCRPVHLADDATPMWPLSHDEFVARLTQYEGMPSELLNDKDVMALIVPTLRADFRVAETHRNTINDTISVPATVIVGNADPSVPVTTLASWKTHFLGDMDIAIVDGGHFFLQEQLENALPALMSILAKVKRSSESVA
nr:alpha/beta fold hydrolase [Luteibacter sp. ME-Dv--P-043b]